MEVTNSLERRQLVNWATQVLETISDRVDAEATRWVEDAIHGLLSDRFCLAVLGKAKRGKSTLMNAILGREDDVVAPVDKLPASSAVSRFRWAEYERATVVFRNGSRESIDFAHVGAFVTEEHNQRNKKGVDVVEIEGPFPSLDRDLELVDTPGAGSIHAHHDQILHAFIPQADAVIFLVTARMPLDQDELDLLRQVKDADIQKVFFAVNRIDESDAMDIADAIAHNRAMLAQVGIHIEALHQISAKFAFEGNVTGSGVDVLLQDIGNFLAESKGKILAERFVARVNAAISPVIEAIQVQLASSQKTAGELNSELAALRDKKATLEAEREFAEREFSMAWTKAVDAYEHGLREARSNVHAAIISKVQRSPLLEASSLAKQLSTVLTNAIEEQVRPAALRFEEEAKDACIRLQASYPSLDIGDGGSVALRTREGHTAISGAVGGTAVAAAGVGFASAGAATAASISAANAAAAAATTTVAAPSTLTGILSFVGLDMLAPLATGTATLAAPSALTTTPIWVALAGPVGWTLAGVGALIVPFSWRVSKLKLKDRMEEACEEQISKVFKELLNDRVPAIRRLGKAIAEEIRLRLDRQLSQVEVALKTARDQRPDSSEVQRLTGLHRRVRELLDQCPRMPQQIANVSASQS